MSSRDSVLEVRWYDTANGCPPCLTRAGVRNEVERVNDETEERVRNVLNLRG